MSSVISATARSHATGGDKSARPANLDADLAKCQSQLSDWVHCVSAKTPEGKAKIEEIASKIDTIKEKMRESEDASASNRTARSTKPTEAASSDSATSDSPRPARGPDLTGLGTFLDVYA
ncbi:MAG: hypothetical protein Q7T97_07230 [Burkholderiaceae bacterium]|nr:hypothetical protein [Burkholderiaceae bacterium]